jgi:hypothetical protein
MSYSLGVKQGANLLQNKQTPSNILKTNKLSSQFIASAAAVGITNDVAKRLFNQWTNFDSDEQYQEAKSIYEGTYDTSYKVSEMNGLPIFDRYVELIGEEEMKLDIVFINTRRKPIMKIINIPGKNFSIKEKLSGGDVEIVLKGSLLSYNPYRYPAEKVKKITDLLDNTDNLKINSNYLNENLKITQVVVKDWFLKEDNKFSNIVNYTITLLSDEEEGISI